MREVLPELRRDRYSAENLAFAARQFMPDGKLSTSTIAKIETGDRAPTVPVMEAVAAALGIGPDAFAEYRLAQARRQLDEREVGLDQALTTLAAIEGVLDGDGAARRRSAAAEVEAVTQEMEERARAAERKRSAAAAAGSAPKTPGRAAGSSGGRKR